MLPSNEIGSEGNGSAKRLQASVRINDNLVNEIFVNLLLE